MQKLIYACEVKVSGFSARVSSNLEAISSASTGCTLVRMVNRSACQCELKSVGRVGGGGALHAFQRPATNHCTSVTKSFRGNAPFLRAMCSHKEPRDVRGLEKFRPHSVLLQAAGGVGAGWRGSIDPSAVGRLA